MDPYSRAIFTEMASALTSRPLRSPPHCGQLRLVVGRLKTAPRTTGEVFVRTLLRSAPVAHAINARGRNNGERGFDDGEMSGLQ